MIRRYLGASAEISILILTSSLSVMAMELFDCSSPHDVTISAVSKSTLLDSIEECLQHRRRFLCLWFARTRSIPVTTFFNHVHFREF